MAKRRTNNVKQKSARKPGRPRRGHEVVTPCMIEQIAELWLQQVSETKIAAEMEIDRKTVHYHLESTIWPLWRENMRSKLAVDLAKVGLIEKVAWARFDSLEPAETHEVIEQSLLENGTEPQTVKNIIRRVTRNGEVSWLHVIQWCLEFRAKIHGHFAPTRHHVDNGGELRVAGMTPTEVDTKMLKRLMEQIVERRKRQQALDDFHGN
jgi:hypothetical protein